MFVLLGTPLGRHIFYCNFSRCDSTVNNLHKLLFVMSMANDVLHQNLSWMINCRWCVKVKVPILVIEHRGRRWPVVGSHQSHRLPGPQWHTCIVINPAVGCHYFPPGPQLPSQTSGIAALRPLPISYTAWWQRHIGVRNLPRVFMPWCPADTRKPRPLDRKSDTLPQHHDAT